MKNTLVILYLILFSLSSLNAQNKPEYHFKFKIKDKSEIDTLTQMISVDNVKGLEIYAYAMPQQFEQFKKLGYQFELIQKNLTKSITMATTVNEMSNWAHYPTYEVYRQMMKNFESDYPSLCKLDSVGTTNNGRQLYVLKISDNVLIEESEPEFFYTSTLHGDETTGFIMMLRLADSLLTTYGTSTQVTTLVNETEIFINPNANPDGTYYGGNHTVSNAIRSNGQADLNRDYPDPRAGDNSPYQPETKAMMNFAEKQHFVMSANFHGGAEVMNYPWDTWYYSENPHADTDWFEKVCTDYVATARTIYPNYMKDVTPDGVTHGATWYKVAGGRQDYMNYWHQCREVTIEISSDKLLAVEELNNYWHYNKQSLLDYLNECLYGIRGEVVNSNGYPLDAKIEIIAHDKVNDSSMVFTDPDNGNYHRLLETGTYDIVASADLYKNDTLRNVSVNWESSSWANFTLEEIDSIALKVNPLFITDTLNPETSKTYPVYIANTGKNTVQYSINLSCSTDSSWISLNKNKGSILYDKNDSVMITVNTTNLISGDYSCDFTINENDGDYYTLPVNMHVQMLQSAGLKSELDGVNVYPNPFTSELTVELNHTSRFPFTVRLISLDGLIVSENEYQTFGKRKELVKLNNLTSLSKGIYLVQILTSQKQETRKIIKN